MSSLFCSRNVCLISLPICLIFKNISPLLPLTRCVIMQTKIKVDINNYFRFNKPRGLKMQIHHIVELALNYKNINKCVNISLLFCDDEYISEINHQFRGKNTATNVLSFESNEMIGKYLFLGDIAISIPTIKKEAKNQGKGFHEHLLHMFTHGVLHLLGFDHILPEEQKEMEQIEDEILQKIFHQIEK